MPRYRGVGAALALVFVILSVLPAGAHADTVSAPQVYVRLFSSYNDQPWVPLSAAVTSMGPYELGIKLQNQPSAEYNRQAVEVDHDSKMG